MRKSAIVVLAAAMLLAAALWSGDAPADNPKPGQRYQDPCGKRFTAREFRAFSSEVWDRDRWERGAPKHRTLRANKHMRRCAVNDRTRRLMSERWRRDKLAFYSHRGYCRNGRVVEGLASYYSGGTTGDGVHNAGEPGIALRYTDTYGGYYRVTVEGVTRTLMHFDWGPAPWTGASIDITEAGVEQFGSSVAGHLRFSGRLPARAKYVPGGCL